MNYKEWIQDRIEHTKKEKTKYYSAYYKNKEVHIHSENEQIYIDWYIDGKLIENPRFPIKIEKEIYWFIRTLYSSLISKNLMYKICYSMQKYLPYLIDEEENKSLRYITIEGFIDGKCS